MIFILTFFYWYGDAEYSQYQRRLEYRGYVLIHENPVILCAIIETFYAKNNMEMPFGKRKRFRKIF